jgi:hypothetical protein
MVKGDVITLNNICEVRVLWCNSDLMQVVYNDLTRKLLKIKNYSITKK